MEYVLTIMVLIAIFVILSSSYNLVIGYGGLATVAHPIFYALGAYTSALLAIHSGLPAVVCVIAGALVAVVASILLALSALAGFGRLSVDRQPRIPARPAAGHQELRVHRRARRPVRDSEHDHRGVARHLHIWRSPAVSPYSASGSYRVSYMAPMDVRSLPCGTRNWRFRRSGATPCR